MKLKYKDIKELRESLLEEQGGKCYLCGASIPQPQEALDHDHATGYIRAVLHADCNILLGKIENFLKGRGKNINEKRLKTFLKRVHDYSTGDWSTMPLHPNHRTPKDRKRSLYKRIIKRSKKESTKEKYRKLLKEI